MKNVLAGMMVVLLGLFITGCEWQTSSDGDSWNSSYSWADFGGVYRPTAGRTFVVSEFGPSSGGTSASTTFKSQSIGTGTAGQVANFDGQLLTPVVAGTVSVRAGSALLTDDGSGNLSGAGTGSINYNTGVIRASFATAPSAGVNVLASYHYSAAGSPGNPQPGSSSAIYTISVDQTGNKLSFRDSNGMTYSGEITSLSGGGNDGSVSGAVVANFNVSGADGSKISGVLQGQYTPNIGVSGAGTLDRIMNGTYSSASGATGDVVGSAGTVNVIVASSGGGTNAPVAP